MDNIINLGECLPQWLSIGYAGENDVRPQTFDFSAWAEEYGAGVLQLFLQRPGDAVPYPVLLNIDGTTATWTPSTADTAAHGQGRAQLVYTVNGAVVKAAVFRVLIAPSLGDSETPPDGFEQWFERLQALEASAADSAEDAGESATAAAASEQNVNAAATEFTGTTVPAAVQQIQQTGAAQIEAIQGAGTTQIAAVNDAGGAQVQAVQEKGAEVLESIPADYSELSGDVVDLKSAMSYSATSDAEDVDLDLVDESGNVILRLADGHIKTKNFDSESIDVEEEVIVKPTAEYGDLFITDSAGNVILKINGGHIKTKGFDSEEAVQTAKTVSKIDADDKYTQFTYTNASQSTVSVEGEYKAGDRLMLHMSNMENTLKDSTSNIKATYQYINANGLVKTLGQEYPYNFFECVLPEDTEEIIGVFPASLIESGSYTCRFIVYKIGTIARKPHIITVSTDGSKDFTSIRAAMDSITDNNAYNRYEIHVWPGTYNILEDYTDDEIRAEGFKGLFVKNGVKIIGEGHREQIVLHGELDPDTYDRATVRNNISTLNMVGNCGLENLTITNRYLRYAVHDDSSSATYQEQTRIVQNCKIVSYDAASGGPGEAAYGAGGAANKKLFISNCDLGERLIIHNGDNFIIPMTVVVQNCTVKIVTLTDCLLSSTYKAPTRVEFDNCNIGIIRHMLSSGHTEPSMILCGTGTHDVMLDIADGILYNFGDCVKFPGAIGAGQAVSVNNQMQIEATDDIDTMYGVSIGNDGTETYVQTRGYINSNTVGLSGLSVGDYVTLDADGSLTDSGATASNAVGIVTAVSQYSSSAIIKLTF